MKTNIIEKMKENLNHETPPIANVLLNAVFRYVWLNLNSGNFSNSWDESQQKYIDDETIERARKDNWKLIKYECLTDENFEFYSMMKIVSCPPNQPQQQ